MYIQNSFGRKFLACAAIAGSVIVASYSVQAGHHESGEAHSAEAKADIVDTAIAADDFNTLVAAVQATELVDTLKGDGPFTVFAPTDAAFAALPEGTLDSLLLPENKDQLTAILTYHVVAGKVMAADIAGKETSATTVQGSDLAINATDGVKINDANVVTADVKTSNGVIHIIDKVLLPE